MNGIIHICFAKIDYKCPVCGIVKSDTDERIYRKIDKSRTTSAIEKCECGIKFRIVVDYTGAYQTYQIGRSNSK
jgi:predicted RNA-binding Zn-ribbon protein involved in translation (DUF1610 family)